MIADQIRSPIISKSKYLQTLSSLKQVGVSQQVEEVAQCSKDPQIPQQMFTNHKGPMKVCLKRPG